MRNVATLLLCTAGLAVLGCQQEPKTATATAKRPVPDAGKVKVDALVRPVPVFLDRSALGSELGPDGTVAKESRTFHSGKPIYLTLVLLESPGGLQTAAVWSDAAEKTLLTDRKKMNGEKVVTFTLKAPKLKPGKYHVIGYWGENIAADYWFEIVGSAKRKN